MAITRVEIQRKIDSYTRQKNNFNKSLNEYKNSLTYVKKLVINLNTSISSISITQDHMSKFFTISGKIPDNNKLAYSKDKLNKMIRELNNTIIPSINNNINSINNNINNLNKEINKLKRELSNM